MRLMVSLLLAGVAGIVAAAAASALSAPSGAGMALALIAGMVMSVIYPMRAR